MNATLRNRFVTDGVAAMSNERILLALYDRLVLDLDKATAAIAARDVPSAHEQLIHAQRIVEELYLAVDTDTWPAGAELVGIYLQCRNLLVQANLHKDPRPVRACRDLVVPLAEAWHLAFEGLQQGPRVATAAAGSFSQGA